MAVLAQMVSRFVSRSGKFNLLMLLLCVSVCVCVCREWEGACVLMAYFCQALFCKVSTDTVLTVMIAKALFLLRFLFYKHKHTQRQTHTVTHACTHTHTLVDSRVESQWQRLTQFATVCHSCHWVVMCALVSNIKQILLVRAASRAPNDNTRLTLRSFEWLTAGLVQDSLLSSSFLIINCLQGKAYCFFSGAGL